MHYAILAFTRVGYGVGRQFNKFMLTKLLFVQQSILVFLSCNRLH